MPFHATASSSRNYSIWNKKEMVELVGMVFDIVMKINGGIRLRNQICFL